ncbi:MAG: hypothetical protein ACI83Y_002601, partial [Candidatus Azotimanducaceae bacterium]
FDKRSDTLLPVASLNDDDSIDDAAAPELVDA